MVKSSCGNCIFFQKGGVEGNLHHQDAGNCMAQPPQMVVMVSDDESRLISRWPITREKYWCGYWDNAVAESTSSE